MEEKEVLEVVENTTEEAKETDTASNDLQKMYTQQEYDAEIKRLKEETEKNLESRVSDEVKKALERAKMSAEEKEKAEFDEEKEKFIKEKEEFNKAKISLNAEKALLEEGLSTDFKEYILSDTEEETLNNIKSFKAIFSKAVEDKVNERLKGNTPKVGAVNVSITKEEFNKMTYSERIKIFKTNPDLYEILKEGK